MTKLGHTTLSSGLSNWPSIYCPDVQEPEDLDMLEMEEKEKELDLGRGNRARKDVAYQEPLSEKDWLKVQPDQIVMAVFF